METLLIAVVALSAITILYAFSGKKKLKKELSLVKSEKEKLRAGKEALIKSYKEESDKASEKHEDLRNNFLLLEVSYEDSLKRIDALENQLKAKNNQLEELDIIRRNVQLELDNLKKPKQKGVEVIEDSNKDTSKEPTKWEKVQPVRTPKKRSKKNTDNKG